MNALKKIGTDLGMGKIILETDCQNLRSSLLEDEMFNGIKPSLQSAVVVREARMLFFLTLIYIMFNMMS